MKKFLVFIVSILLCINCLADISKADKVKINIILAEQADAQELIRMAEAFPTKAERREFVINTLKRQAADAQAGLIEELNILEANGLVEEIRPLWLVNSVSCYANEEAVSAISQRKDILAVYQCEEFQCIEDVSVMSSERGDGREIAENIVKVNADQVWALGYTGENVLVALIDTGARLDHADLQGRLWDGGAEYPNHGYDFYQHDNDPSDTHGHGTHVAGTIVGTGVSGTQTGVAPGATLMVLKVFHGEDNLSEVTMWVEAMQFAVEHGADVMNMSLGQPLPDSSVKHMLRQACDNTLAAGVVAAVCAGNSRQIQMLAPVPYNIWSPGDCPPPHLHEDQMVNAGGTSCVICVGAVNNNDVLGDFSSEGPATWSGVAPYNDYPYSSGGSTNIGLIRPDVCAPGVNVKSLDFNTTNGYCLKSGTSMATPCVAGTIALMLSKDHELTPEQIDEILERTAVPLSAHKSNDFGSGRIDALAAVNAVGDDGVEEIDNEDITVYPNPVNDIVMIETHGRASLQNVIIYDVNGRKVLSTSESKIDISDIPSGIYMMKIELSDGIFYKKIIKE
ncbi:MAG: S8 family peptidase [Bacteroidales bacterium]|nr:S8 family peptidase [Bacteroidales bacterium]